MTERDRLLPSSAMDSEHQIQRFSKWLLEFLLYEASSKPYGNDKPFFNKTVTDLKRLEEQARDGPFDPNALAKCCRIKMRPCTDVLYGQLHFLSLSQVEKTCLFDSNPCLEAKRNVFLALKIGVEWCPWVTTTQLNRFLLYLCYV